MYNVYIKYLWIATILFFNSFSPPLLLQVFLALFVHVTLVWSKAVDLPQQQVAFPNDDASSQASLKRDKKSPSNDYAQPGLQ